jgi:hypothetical protein
MNTAVQRVKQFIGSQWNKNIVQRAPMWPDSAVLNGETYHKQQSPTGIYYQTSDFSRSNGCYISIHNPGADMEKWEGQYWTKSHASRKKVCQITWTGNGAEVSVSYTAGETALTDDTEKSTQYQRAQTLGKAFIKKYASSYLR